MRVSDLFVDDPVMSDHSFITINLALGIIKIEAIATIVQRRRWRDVDQQSFSTDLASARLTGRSAKRRRLAYRLLRDSRAIGQQTCTSRRGDRAIASDGTSVRRKLP